VNTMAKRTTHNKYVSPDDDSYFAASSSAAASPPSSNSPGAPFSYILEIQDNDRNVLPLIATIYRPTEPLGYVDPWRYQPPTRPKTFLAC
jgi:hypothetical protein